MERRGNRTSLTSSNNDLNKPGTKDRSHSESPLVHLRNPSQAGNSSTVSSNSSRPRSGCSDTSYNFDTPLTPHFNQQIRVEMPSTSAPYNIPRSAASTPGVAASANLSYQNSPGKMFFGDNFVQEDATDQEILVFTEPPNKKLCCNICKNVFKEPVITTCGHTFCKICVEKSEGENCPIDGKPSAYIVDNIALSEQIGELYIHCKYGCKRTGPGNYIVDERGCPTTVKMSERYHHERDCEFAPMECPNNPDCAKFPKKDLENHLQNCTSMACPNKKYGCKFVDSKANLSVHLDTCEFEAFKEVLQEREETINQLKQQNTVLQENIAFLSSSMKGVSERLDSLETDNANWRGILGSMDLSGVLESLCQEVQESKKEREALKEELDQLKLHCEQSGAGYMSAYDPEPIVKCKGTFVGHDGPIWCLAASNDYVFSGSSDNTIKVWDTSTNYKCVKTLNGHTGIVLALAIHGNILFSGSQDMKMLVWNIEKDKDFELVTTVAAHDNPVCTLATSRGQVFSGSLKTVKVWDTNSDEYTLKRELTGFNHWVRALYTTEKQLFCGSYQTIEIYCLDSLDLVTTLKTYGGSVYSICVTDKYIMCGTYEKVIHVWESGTMEQMTTLQGHSGTVYALAWMNSPMGNIVFSASYDRTIRVWSVNNMLCKQTLIRHTGSVACLVVSKGRLFSGAIDNNVKVWQ